MKVLMASPECVPFSKTGGLADVAGTLPKWLRKAGVDVRIVLPKYKMTDDKKFGLKDTGAVLKIPIGDKVAEARILKGSVPAGGDGSGDVPVYFIKNDGYFKRDGLYGDIKGDYPDNHERFIFFCRAALELVKTIEFKPDVIHTHDWQTGLIPAYLKTAYKYDSYFTHTKTVFTIHNIAYQGNFPKEVLYQAGFTWGEFTPERLEYYGKVSFLKSGLVYSDAINTVSPTYAEQIQSSNEFGRGMEGVLSHRKADLSGIINGIDYNDWDPEKDRFIAQGYSLNNKEGKAVCKQALQKEVGLPQKSDVPFLGIVSRLDPQKGFDLLAEIIGPLLKKEVQLIILGTGDKTYHDLLSKIAKKHKKQFSLHLTFDNALAHRIYAGCDFFLMPSRFEPCGLGQMIASRYLTVPVVMKTGGLADTIHQFGSSNPRGNGFVFSKYAAKDFLKAVLDALKAYKKQKQFAGILNNLYSADFRWESSVREYISLYSKIAGR